MRRTRMWGALGLKTGTQELHAMYVKDETASGMRLIVLIGSGTYIHLLV